MKVFSVEMLVKEEGAAVVQAALGRLRKEAAATATDLKATTQSVTQTGRAMQTAGQATEISGGKAAKAAIGFAAVGQSLARTGSLTADAGTRIIEAGSQIAMMFGPTGLAVGALLGFAVAAVTSFSKTRDEAQKMAEETQKALRSMVLGGDIAGIDKQLRDVQQGILDLTSGEFTGGLDDLRARYASLKKELDGFVITQRGSVGAGQNAVYVASAQERAYTALTVQVSELSRQIADLEAKERSLLRARQLAGRFTPEAISGAATPTGSRLGKLPGPGSMATTFGKRPEESIAEMQKRIPQAIGPMLSEAQRAAAEAAVALEQTFTASISMALTTGIVAGIENAVATGNIGEGFKALSTTLLAGLGDAMIQFGTQSAAFAGLMDTIMKSLSSMLPGGALVASLTMIGIGAALKGVARGMFNKGGGRSGAAFSSVSFGGGTGIGQTTQIIFGATSATAAAGMTPRSSTNVTIIGPNDPSAQRAMQELLAKANSRGRVG